MRLAPAVLMVRPACFGYNPEAAETNVFARQGLLDVAGAARREIDRAVEVLRDAGVRVVLVEDTPDPPKPDAVFPNNWVSFHPDGTVVLYPLAVASRRPERRSDILRAVRPWHGTTGLVDLSDLEKRGAYLEGTGSLLLDHDARMAWAALSPRTTRPGLEVFVDRFGYDVVVFEAVLDGAPLYHTNVGMALGPQLAVLALPLVTPGAARDALLASLSGREILSIGPEQVRDYAGNLLFLATPAGPAAVMSRRAEAAFTRAQLGRLGRRVVLDIDTIETVGGGSARCLLAEIFPASAPAPSR